MGDEIPIMKELQQILDGHHLDCKCTICTAYTNGNTAAEGMMQAADVLRHQRGAGLFERPN
jgi:hypothetical protein